MYGNESNTNEQNNKDTNNDLTYEQMLKIKESEKLLREKNQEIINDLIERKKLNKEIFEKTKSL